MPGRLAQIQGSRSHARQCSLAALLRIPSVESSLLSDYMESPWAALPQPRGCMTSQQTLKHQTVASFLRRSDRGPEWLSNWRSFSWSWNHSLKSQVTLPLPLAVSALISWSHLDSAGEGPSPPPAAGQTAAGLFSFVSSTRASLPFLSA